jgi:hypothetical protein
MVLLAGLVWLQTYTSISLSTSAVFFLSTSVFLSISAVFLLSTSVFCCQLAVYSCYQLATITAIPSLDITWQVDYKLLFNLLT